MIAAVHAAVKRKGTKQGPELETNKRQHVIFPWVNTGPGMELEEISSEDMTKKHGMREDVFRDYLLSEIKEEEHIMSLPWALLSVILYGIVLLTHASLHVNNSIESAVEFDIADNANFAYTAPMNAGHKDFKEVNTPADFWSWMTRGYVPLVFPEEAPSSEDSNLFVGNAPVDRLAWHNLKLGPIRLAQEAADEIDCANKGVAGAYGLTCARSPDLNLDMSVTESQVQLSNFREEAARTVWLHSNVSYATEVCDELEKDKWWSKDASRITVSMLLYNAQADILLLTNVNFMMSRTGRVWKFITHNSLNLLQYRSTAGLLADILFYAQVVWLFFTEVKEIVLAVRQDRLHPLEGLKSYFGFWNVVDWAYIIAAIVHFGLQLAVSDRAGTVQSLVLSAPTGTVCDSEECQSYFANLFTLMTETYQANVNAKVFSAIVPLVIMMRMFKAFAAQPRLALVTETLHRAWMNLAHYLVVFSAIFMSFAIMGVGFFGRESAEFATLDRAIPTLFLMLLGSFEFDNMSISGRGYAFFFFAVFMFLITLVMLSMLIAIIMDVYVEVKQDSRSSEPVWVELFELVSRAWQIRRGERMPLKTILSYLSRADANTITLSSLLKEDSEYYVPGLSEEQAEDLLTGACESWSIQHTPAVVPGDVKKFVDGVYRDLEPLCDSPGLEAVEGPGEASPSTEPTEAQRIAENASLYEILAAVEARMQRSGPQAPTPITPKDVAHRASLASVRPLLEAAITLSNEVLSI